MVLGWRDSPAKTRELANARTAKRKMTARDIMFATGLSAEGSYEEAWGHSSDDGE